MAPARRSNDLTESEAIGIVFGKRGPHVPVSSTKPVHGHGLGVGGAFELIVTLGALRENIAPPTINWRVSDEKCPVDCIPNEARADADQCGHVEFLRLWRDQCDAWSCGASMLKTTAGSRYAG